MAGWNASTLESLAAFDPESLERPALGEMNFSILRWPIESTTNLIEQVSTLPDMSFNEAFAVEAKAHSDAFSALLERIGHFSIAGPNAASEHASIVHDVLDERDWWVRVATPWLRARDVDLDALKVKAESDYRAAQGYKEEIEAILKAAREVAGVKLASATSKHFADQEKNASRLALRFFVAGIVLFAILVGGALYFIVTPLEVDSASPAAWLDLARLAAPRLFLLGLITYALRFAARGYSIARHEGLASTQRKQSLDTFILLTASVQDEAARREVYTEIVRLILSPYETGYLKGNESGRWDALGLGSLFRRPD